MKRLIYALIIIAMAVLLASFLAEPVIVSLVKKKIRKVFRQSSVSIGNCEFSLVKGIRFSDIEITRGAVYDLKARKLKVAYILPDILKGSISKVSLEGANIRVNMGNKDIQEFLKHCNFSSKGAVFLIEALELSGLKLNLKSANLNIDAQASAGFSWARRALDFIDLEISQFQSAHLSLNDLTLKVNRGNAPQGLYIREAGYDKIRVKEVKSKVNYNAETITLAPLSLEVLKGKAQAKLNVTLGKTIVYALDLKAANLDLQDLAEDLKLTKEFQITGKAGGRLQIRGEGLRMNIIDGEFAIGQPGGALIIKDKKIIENMARSSALPYEILVEGFRNYRYNKGQAAVGLEGSDIILSAVLEGDAGRRSFDIRWHNFTIGKE